MNDTYITDAAEQFGSLLLTQAGKCILSAYPEAAVKYADQQLQRHKDPHSLSDPFKYVLGIANNYCKEIARTPNWAVAKQLKAQFYVNDDDPTYEAIVKKTNQETQKRTQWQPEEPTYVKWDILADEAWDHIDLIDAETFIAKISSGEWDDMDPKVLEEAAQYFTRQPNEEHPTISYVYRVGKELGLVPNELNMRRTSLKSTPKPLTEAILRKARHMREAGFMAHLRRKKESE